MNPELVQLMKESVDRFNICSETYYHAVLLFNVIQLKKNQQSQFEYFTIPIKKRSSYQSSDDQSDNENDNSTEPEIQFVTMHHTEIPQRDKLDLTVCLFLVHKLYEPYPLCLSYLMKHLEIDERFQDYIISLEKEFLIKLSYKIENLLPSNEAIFACHLWDEFVQNIDSTCIDIRFGISQIFECSKNQIRTSHEINRGKIQPEFKTIQKKSFDSLSRNIQILVHNKAIYQLYIKKSVQQTQDDIPSMKKIGLAITYVTIYFETSMVFNKKYSINQKDNLSYKRQKNQYLEFVFNDFLSQNFGLSLTHLMDEIDLVHSILQNKIEKSSDNLLQKNTKVSSIKTIEEAKSSEFAKFLFRVKKKPTIHEYHFKYHTKCKVNKSLSSTKTDKQSEAIQRFYMKRKCHSILGKKSINQKNKYLQSTLHQSNISEKASSLRRSASKKKENLGHVKGIYVKKNQKSAENFGNSYKKSLILSTQKGSSKKYCYSLMNSKSHHESYQGHYKVSQFVSIDI